MEDYLKLSTSIKMVFVLLDVRHEPSQLDKMMISYLFSQGLPFSVIATKTDKLSKSSVQKNLALIEKSLNIRKEMIFLHSSLTGQGKEDLLNFIEQSVE